MCNGGDKEKIVRKQLYFRYVLVNNPLPDDKILALSKLKAFADDNFDADQMAQFFFDRLENMMEKGENAGYQHFLLFPSCFQKFLFYVDTVVTEKGYRYI